MLAHQVDAAHHHPLIVSLELLVADVVAAECKGFGKNLLLAGLRCGGAKLRHGQAGENGTAQPVHARDMIILIVRHAGTVTGQLGFQRLLQYKVAGIQQAVCGTPIIDLLIVILGEQLGDQLPEVHSGLLPFPSFDKQLDQMIVDRLTVCLFVLLGQNKAPRNAVTRDLRLVGKEAVKGGAVLCVVRLVDFIDKVCNNLAVQGVYVEGVDLVVEAVILEAINHLGTSGIL